MGTIAERLEHPLQQTADNVGVKKVDHKIICKMAVGKQLFTITCKKMPPDRDEPAV